MWAFLCEQNMDWMEEKITNFYSKRNGEKKSQIKRKKKLKERRRDKEIVRLRYRVVGR